MPRRVNLLPQALKALGIKNPIYRYEQKGNTVTIWFYAHREPVTWRKPPAPRRKTKKAEA